MWNIYLIVFLIGLLKIFGKNGIIVKFNLIGFYVLIVLFLIFFIVWLEYFIMEWIVNVGNFIFVKFWKIFCCSMIVL